MLNIKIQKIFGIQIILVIILNSAANMYIILLLAKLTFGISMLYITYNICYKNIKLDLYLFRTSLVNVLPSFKDIVSMMLKNSAHIF